MGDKGKNQKFKKNKDVFSIIDSKNKKKPLIALNWDLVTKNETSMFKAKNILLNKKNVKSFRGTHMQRSNNCRDSDLTKRHVLHYRFIGD